MRTCLVASALSLIGACLIGACLIGGLFAIAPACGDDPAPASCPQDFGNVGGTSCPEDGMHCEHSSCQEPCEYCSWIDCVQGQWVLGATAPEADCGAGD